MFVDPAMLNAGAAHSHSAAEHVRAGAASLDQTPVTAGIFGGFGAADVFHQAVATSRTEHLTTLTDHRRALTELADKAHHACRAFRGLDHNNAADLHAVRCNSAT